MHVLGNNEEMNRDTYVDNYGGSMMMAMDMMCRRKTIQKLSPIHSLLIVDLFAIPKAQRRGIKLRI